MSNLLVGPLVWDDSRLDRILRGTGGPVARDAERRALAIESRAKQNASGRPGPNVITGRLRSGILAQPPQRDALGVYADVASTVEYGGFVERGTERARPYPYLLPAAPAGGGTSVA